MTAPVPPVPARLAGRPLDRAGRVIGWVTARHPDGSPMNGTNVGMLCARAILERLCGQCGDPLTYWICFIGDEASVRRREFLEPPMHEECGRYAFAVCPYLLTPGYVGTRQRPGVITLADRSRPDRMALYVCRDYRPVFDSDAPMSRAAAPKRIEWYPPASRTPPP